MTSNTPKEQIIKLANTGHQLLTQASCRDPNDHNSLLYIGSNIGQALHVLAIIQEWADRLEDSE